MIVSRLIEILSKQNATPEEKHVQALLNTALLSDSLLRFMDEVYSAVYGFGKVQVQTVKDVVEFAKAHNEAAICKTSCSDEQKEVLVTQETNRLIEAEVWVLEALAHWGLLER